MKLQRHETDILILGSGGAGLFAALHAKKAAPDLKVTVAVKGLMGKSGCTRMVFTPASRCTRIRSRIICSVPSRLVCNTISSGTSAAASSRFPSSQSFWTATASSAYPARR